MAPHQDLVELIGGRLAIGFDHVLEPVLEPVTQQQLLPSRADASSEIGTEVFHLVDHGTPGLAIEGLARAASTSIRATLVAEIDAPLPATIRPLVHGAFAARTRVPTLPAGSWGSILAHRALVHSPSFTCSGCSGSPLCTVCPSSV
jgi:hypothetical protein